MKQLSVQDSQNLFLYGCIPSRILLIASPHFVKNHEAIRKLLSCIFIAIGLGFLIIYIFDLRKTGIETGGRKIWWNEIRQVHGILYLVAGILLFNREYESVKIILAIDIIIGIIIWKNYHNK